MHPVRWWPTYKAIYTNIGIRGFSSGSSVRCRDRRSAAGTRAPGGGVVLTLAHASVTVPDTTVDAALIAALAAGDQGAAASMFDRYAPLLMSVAFRVTRSHADAEEVVLEALEQAWRQAARYDLSRGTIEAWLLMIVRSRAFDRMRSGQRHARHLVSIEDHPADVTHEHADESASPADFAEAAEARQIVSQALASLPPAQRESVTLAFYDGLSHSEVAEKLGEPLGTVKTRIRLGMLKLRELLRPLAPEVHA